MTAFNASPKSAGFRERIVRVKVYPNSSSACSYVTQGGIASVARDAAGKFLITGDRAFYGLASIQATYVETADNVDLYAQGGLVANLATATAWTAFVKLKTGATNTDAGATDADRYISVDLTFEETTL